MVSVQRLSPHIWQDSITKKAQYSGLLTLGNDQLIFGAVGGPQVTVPLGAGPFQLLASSKDGTFADKPLVMYTDEGRFTAIVPENKDAPGVCHQQGFTV